MSVLQHMFRKDPNFSEGVLFGLVALAICTSSQLMLGSWWLNALSFASFLIFFCLTLGNFMFPAKDGHVFLPLYRWWQKNATVYEVSEHGDQKYYSHLIDSNCRSLFDKNGWQIGWQMTSKERTFYLVPWEDLRKEVKPPRMHWLARMRSPSIA